jgi:hypothetical protein
LQNTAENSKINQVQGLLQNQNEPSIT